MISKIHQKLLSLKDEKYLDFQKKIITRTSYQIIGVRLPELRTYAKELLKENKQIKFKDKYYEEVLLHGFYLAGAKCSFSEKIELIDEYLSLIDNWGICDSFVSSLKDINKNKDTYYPYLLKHLKTDKEYYQRFALVVLLTYYLEDKYLKDIYKIIKTQKYNGYYSKIAAAWLLSCLFMFYFEETINYIKNNKLDEFVYKKGIQKALDSYRLDKRQKDILRSLN